MGGMMKQYQVIIDPQKLRAYDITLAQVKKAIQNSNQAIGGDVIELAEAEYMVRATGYIKNINDLKNVPIKEGKNGQRSEEHTSELQSLMRNSYADFGLK